MLDEYIVEFPEDFDVFEDEIKAKGVYAAVLIAVGERRYRPTFFDTVRLRREYEDELKNGAAAYVEANVVVIPAVTRKHIDAAIKQLAGARFLDLLPEPEPG